jgi:hypothetical protein
MSTAAEGAPYTPAMTHLVRDGDGLDERTDHL